MGALHSGHDITEILLKVTLSSIILPGFPNFCRNYFQMSDMPQDGRCSEFVNYIVLFVVTSESRFMPSLWVAVPVLSCKRMNNGPQSFHSHFSEQSYAAHPSIFIFFDVLKKLQFTTYTKVRSLNTESTLRRVDRHDQILTGSVQKLPYDGIDRDKIRF